VLLVLAEIAATDADELYSGIHALPWEEHLDPDGSLAVDFGGTCVGIDHSHYGAQRVKDAIVDRFRDVLRPATGRRPAAAGPAHPWFRPATVKP
jgi:23S rRNA (guanine2445-N2)-methyltransferase / 23S rRNA (guanine2069-N7)-methyltransferase